MVWPTEFDLQLDEFDVSDLPGQQLLATHANSTLEHALNLDLKASPGCQRLTGIMACMGKSTYDVEIIEKMILAGMNVAVLNMSFGSREEHVEAIKMIKQATKNVSIRMGKNCPLAVAAILTGRKIRTGRIAESYGESVELKTDDTIRLTSDETYRERCSSSTVFVDFLNLGDHMSKNDFVLLDNEAIMLKVEIISTSTITCRIERGGILGSYKGVIVPNVVFDVHNFSEKDKLDIDMLVKNQIDIMIASFTHGPESISELKTLLGEKGKKILVIGNISSQAGFKRFDEIARIADGLLISRQELGSDISAKKLVIAQKNMIARANKLNIPIFVSSQLLSSMTTRKLPLRAELLDAANCVLDGVDALILSSETAIGNYPVETVACLANACKEAEACVWTKQIFSDLVSQTPFPADQVTCSAMAGVLAAQRCIAAAIVVVTTSGKSAQIVSKYKPRCPIIAVTRYATIARHLHMFRGVIPLIYEDLPDSNWQVDVQNRIHFCTIWGIDLGFIRVGDPMIVISGWRQGSGFTNTMRVIYASLDAKSS